MLAETAGEAADAVKAGSSPANPVHNCTKKDDGTDTTAWSYVYFGSYPQTEVTGSALTAAITGASYDANGDAWVSGTKYRRMKKSDANYSSSSSREQGAIVSQTVVNEDNPDYNTEGGNDTTDKVFLLSLSEVMNPDYGFCEDYSTYSVSRRVKPSDYAHARGAWVSTSTGYAGNCWWWLRSPGDSACSAASVSSVRRRHQGLVMMSSLAMARVCQLCILICHLISGLWRTTEPAEKGKAAQAIWTL